jgi:Ca2+-binding EF-hand superfamily protein
MARPGQRSLTLEDFLHFLPEEQALRAFQLFEMNAAGEITKRALAKWVISVYNEHRALSLTLSDSRTVIAKLHKVLTAVSKIERCTLVEPYVFKDNN